MTRVRATGLFWVLLVATATFAACSGQGCGGPQSGVTAISDAHLPRIDLRLFVLTDPMGTLEPCGCTSRPLGGIDRLGPMLDEGRRDGVPTLFLSAGDLFFDAVAVEQDEAATQEIWKAETMAEVLSRLRLDATVPGALDARFGPDVLANVRTHARFSLLTNGHEVRSAGNLRVGLVGLTDMTEADGEPTNELDFSRIAAEHVSAARSEGADVVVVLARIPRRAARRIADEVAGIDFFVLGGVDSEIVDLPATTEHGVLLHAGRRVQGLLTVDIHRSAPTGAWNDGSGWTRTAERTRLTEDRERLQARIAEWERDPAVLQSDLSAQRERLVEIDARVRSLSRSPEASARTFVARYLELAPEAPRDPQLTAALDSHFRRVNEHNRDAFADVLPRPAPPGTASYIGSEACGSCHGAALSWWRTTQHGHAYRTLEERHKEFNLSCVGCHVTGYNRPGGSTVAHVEHLENVGCENCHGPGSAHEANPREAMLTRDVSEPTCLQCHTPEHSDRFVYSAYRRLMIAPGHGAPVERPEG